MSGGKQVKETAEQVKYTYIFFAVEQYRESIFQPFFRVDKSRSRENGGVGLGLSLVWEIATLHGGDVRVEKSSEKGTTIAVKLPLDTQTD